VGTGGGAKLHKLQHRTEKPFLGENNRKRSIILMFLLFVELIRSASEARKIFKKKTRTLYSHYTFTSFSFTSFSSYCKRTFLKFLENSLNSTCSTPL